ncbi:hypothetical protein TRFO_20505 [Tritrichomonas foetus]|uniref:FMP27 GFWDK domain-containing protein n=1 Tax=Tritrichomonas foetus TaxID=1144522 RepID=A0A1J4KFL3_9EUKA|nr:hypothetical protein TRFO_20505 [Tritrichomonas foetus]|eukprot:OHT10215.1 hypothetical protein TRFO_20505 [Tritrichomonas foetus]
MADTNSVEIPWGVVLTIFIFAIVLLYFLFFQQYLTALIWRMFIGMFIPKTLQINFERVMFSVVSGHITIFDLTIVTQDMSIRIGKFCGQLYFWRKIPDFSENEPKLKSRFLLQLFGLDITIYNRTWSTELVENVVKMFNEGKTTKEVGEYVLSFYPTPAPYQLSMLLRMILPLKIRIYSAALTIGNPRTPSFLIFRFESISGQYTLIPRKSPEFSMQSSLNLDMNTFSLKSIPLTINETDWFKKSMRNVYDRSHCQYQIMHAENIELSILTDLYGLYSGNNDENSINQVTKEPQMRIDATFNGYSAFQYGPYTDKLRRFFMEFYTPFVFNDPLIYPESRKRIKYWEVNLYFPEGSFFEIPFVTDQDLPPEENEDFEKRKQSKEKRKGALTLSFGDNSKIQMFIPQYIASHAENKMELNGVFSDVKVSTSTPGISPYKESPPLIESKSLNLNVGMYYPEEWNGITQMTVFVNFQSALVVLAPYHIDFLTQLGTDWAAWYPFQTQMDTIFNFFPYSYFVTIAFEKSIIKLFTETTPNYEQFNAPDDFPHAEIRTTRLIFKLAAPLIQFNESKKSVTFSADLDRTKVDFYLPDNHMMRIRRGHDKEFDYVTMDRFQLSGSYRWCVDPHEDCQIPMNMRISNVGGLITIGTLVTLIGTIANYTSRKRVHPKVWNDQDPPPSFEYINNSNVIVSIDQGTIKVPLDLYEPTNCAIAHASGLLIGIEGYHPFWHVIVDIACAVVELPRTNFPYDNYFDQCFADVDGPKQGTFHVEYIHISMKTIALFTGYIWHELQSKIICEIGRIDGYALMPQLMSGLEIAWNIIHSFFSDDSFPIQKMHPFLVYRLEVFRICIGSIHVYLDMGSIGLLAAMLPGGVIVYSDTLIDENANYSIFVHLPSIDAHLLQADPQTGQVHAILRASTYLNVVRDITLDDNQEDAKRQLQILKMYDVMPNPERHPKRNYYSYLFDFINQDKAQLDEEYFAIPEMMRPETYHSSLNEVYELTQILVTDPRNNNEYSLPIPELRYKSYKTFINMEDGIQWLHHYETVRFYNHLSPTRGFSKIPQADPSKMSELYYADDCKRAKFTHGAVRLVLPNRVIAQLRPEALVNAAALLNSMNLMCNDQLMAKIVRSTVSDEYDLKNYHSNTINVILPQVCVFMTDPDFDIVVSVDSVNIRYVKMVRPVLDKNLTLYIKAVSLACSLPDSENAAITTTIPEIRLVNVNYRGALKIDPIKFNLGSRSPILINLMIQKLSKFLDGFPIPSVGDRVDELIRIFESNSIFEKEFEEIKSVMYDPGECNTRHEINAKVSAYYATLRQLKLFNYSLIYKLVRVPPKPIPIKKSKMELKLPNIIVNIRHSSSKQSTLKLVFLPQSIFSQNETTLISCGIKSLKVSLQDEIVSFIKDVIPKPDKESTLGNIQFNSIRNFNDNNYFSQMSKMHHFKNCESNTSKFKIHAVINSISISLNQISLRLENFSFISNITNYTFIASFTNFTVSINEWIKILFEGVSLSHDGETGEGFVHIKPIKIFVFLDFILHTQNYLDKEFLESFLTRYDEEEDKNDDDFSDDTSSDSNEIKSQRIFHDSRRSSRKRTDNELAQIRSQIMAHRKSRKATNKALEKASHKVSHQADITEVLKNISTSLLIEELQIVVAATDTIRAEVSFPRTCGFMHYSIDSSVHFLCYFHQPHFLVQNYFGFPMPNFLFILKLRKYLIDAVLMIGEILAVGNSERLSTIAYLVNEVLSKLEGPVEEKDVIIKPIKKKTEDTSPQSKTKIRFRFELPRFETKLDEIYTVLSLNQVSGEVDLKKSQLTWKFDIDDIVGKVFDSVINTSVCGKSSRKTKFRFKITPLDIVITHDLFTKLPLFSRFVNSITEGLKKQEKVSSLLLQLNDNIKQTVETHADQLLETIITKPVEKMEFPTITGLTTLFSITDIRLKVVYNAGGAFISTIPEIKLVVQIRESEFHQKQAIGAQFVIRDLGILLDTDENSGKKVDQLSSLKVSALSISALSFLNNVDLESIVDGLKIEIYPTIPAAIAKVLTIISTIHQSANAAKKESMSRSSSVPSFANTNVKHQSSPLAKKKDEIIKNKEEKAPPQVNGLFKCIHTEIILSPISNNLPIPSVEVTCMAMNENILLTLKMQNKVVASLSPSLLGWLNTFKSMLPLLNTKLNSKNPRNEDFMQKHQKTEKQSKQYPQQTLSSPKEKIYGIKSYDILSPFNKSNSSFSSNSTCHYNDEDEKLPLSIQFVLQTKEIEICFGCQPRRSDISCLVGISCINAVGNNESNSINVVLYNIYLRTHNVFALQTPDSITSRLFEFTIPRVDMCLGINNIIILIEKIFTTFSSDKIEEISLFNDIWIQPLLKMLNTNTNKNKNNSSSDNLNNISSHNSTKITNLINPNTNLNGNINASFNNTPGNNNFGLNREPEMETPKNFRRFQLSDDYDSSSYTEEEETLDNKHDYEYESKMKITFAIKTVELYFNYAGGAGNLYLVLQPIRVSKTPGLLISTINSITLNSAGQLLCKFDLDGFLYMMSEFNNALMNVVQFQSILLNMSIAEEPFLQFSLLKMNLLCRIGKEETGDANTLLQISLDSPDAKLTALTVPNLKTFIKTISEPIIAGVARASRSDETKKKVKKVVEKFLPLYANLDVLFRRLKVVLLRYDFKDTDAILFSIKAAMLHLGLQPAGRGMNRNLHFQFLPIALQRLTNDSSTTSKSRNILKLPKIEGILDTQQAIIDDANITYNFITEFSGNIEPTLNLSDYEWLVTLIKYMVANLNLGKAEHSDDEEASDESLEKMKSKKSKKKKQKNSKVQFNFTPLNYQFAPGFKVGIGAAYNPDIAWLLARFGISDEHIIPASLFEYICLGLESFLSTLTKSMTKASK